MTGRSMKIDQKWEHLRAITRPALRLAPRSYLHDIRANLVRDGISDAVAFRDTPWILDCLIGAGQFQGISDTNAASYTAKHGIVGWEDIAIAVAGKPSCPRLQSFWHFAGCGYSKAKGACTEP